MFHKRNWSDMVSGRLKSRRPGRRSRLSVESLETRTLLTTLHVDVNDPACSDVGDNVYCQIQDAIPHLSSAFFIHVSIGPTEDLRVRCQLKSTENDSAGLSHVRLCSGNNLLNFISGSFDQNGVVNRCTDFDAIFGCK